MGYFNSVWTKHMQKLAIILLGALTLVGCKHLHRITKHVQENTPVPIEHPALHNFHRLDVQGHLNVNLHSGATHPHISLHGDARDKAHVRWRQVDDTVFIFVDKGYRPHDPVRLDIYTHHFNALNYTGQGEINGQHLQAPAFDLHLNNTGKTTLEGRIDLREMIIDGNSIVKIHGIQSRFMRVKMAGRATMELVGMANVASIEMSGHSWLSMYWVKSPHLRIRNTDQSYVQLAGYVQLLNIELKEQAHFNGEHLRAVRSFVKTFDHSRADIAVIKSDHALANDSSNIYYYELPVMKADFMGSDGSILDMRNFSSPFIKEPTPYNR